jgi:hypothetical protein
VKHTIVTAYRITPLLLTLLISGCPADSGVAPISTESSEAQCTDSLDNDNDRLVDCEDTDCSLAAACGGTGFPDGGSEPALFDAGTGTVDTNFTPCQSTVAEATPVGGGVDIIIFIDTSGSMNQETAWVQQNINAFASYIGGLSLDYRVVLIADGDKICVPAPLGGPGCTDGPNFRHVKVYVGSRDGLKKTINTYSQYQDFLRADTTKNFVAITDDNSTEGASWFKTELAKLTNPGFADGFFYHSIVAYGDIEKKGCSTGAKIGQAYLDLTDETGGVKFKVCETDWSSIFDAMAQSVASSAALPCTYPFPDPGEGKLINPFQIKVNHLSEAGVQQEALEKLTKTTCGDGWYFDDDTTPTSVILCPKTCERLQDGKIQVDFGCMVTVD